MNVKKLVLLCAALAPAVCGLTACNQSATEIGVLQFGDFDALNKAYEGFKAGLEEGGFGNLKIDYQNAHADGPTASTLAKGLASKNHKLNLAIATPCATAMKAAQDNIGNTTPLLFTATTDPSGLMENQQQPEGYITGTSDLQPEEALTEQVNLVKKMIPGATKFGICYCSSETNSQFQAAKAKTIAESQGLEVVTKTCVDQFSIASTISALADEVDAIWVPTDNTIANSIGKVKEGLGNKKVLLISGEEGMLAGMHVTVSITYFDLGKKTAELACQILKGTAVKDIPVYYSALADCKHVYNDANLTAAGFSASDLPTEYTWEKR